MNKKIEKILEAVQEEYNEHEDCGYNVGCILTSETLKDKIKSLLLSTRQEVIDEVIAEMKDLYNKSHGANLEYDEILAIPNSLKEKNNENNKEGGQDGFEV